MKKILLAAVLAATIALTVAPAALALDQVSWGWIKECMRQGGQNCTKGNG